MGGLLGGCITTFMTMITTMWASYDVERGMTALWTMSFAQVWSSGVCCLDGQILDEVFGIFTAMCSLERDHYSSFKFEYYRFGLVRKSKV